MTDLPEKLLEILVCLTIAKRGTCLPFSCEKPNALSRKKWRTRYCPSLHSRRPWFVLVYDPAEDNLVKLSTFSPKKSCQTFNFFPKKILSNFQLFFSKNPVKLSTFYFFLKKFFLENLVKLLTLFPQKILSNFQLFSQTILSKFQFVWKILSNIQLFSSENLVNFQLFPQKILSNFQLFYFNYCYNEASRLGALSRYQIKREETSDEGGVLIQSQKEHEF